MSLVPNNDPNAGILASPNARAAADDLLELGLEPIANIDDDDDANSVRVFIVRAAPGLGYLSLQRHALSLTISSTLHSQAVLNKPKKARHSLNGDPMWRMVEAPAVIGDALTMKLCGLANVVGEDLSPMKAAKDAGFGTFIDSLAMDGGGWSLACKASGEVSALTGDVTWVYRCKSACSLGCPAKMKIIVRKIATTCTVLHATGWAHDHTGPIATITGLPPPVKQVIETFMEKNATAKFTALWNHLVDGDHVTASEAMKGRVSTYFYKGSKARKADHVAKLGVSSYGCVAAWVEQHRLVDMIMNHTPTPNKTWLDVAGVIGALVRPQEAMCAVFVSTPKLLLDAFALGTSGYGNGQLHLDHTYKLLHEQIPWLVTSTPDIAQHVHLIGLGPTTHMDADMTGFCLKAQKEAIEMMVAIINKHSWSHTVVEPPVDQWPVGFVNAIETNYKPALDHWLQIVGTGSDGSAPSYMYKPGRAMADDATALKNAARAVINDCIEMNMCWVHVWRAVKGKHNLLNRNTEARQKELYTDLAFIQALAMPELVAPALAKFDSKWRTSYGETAMANYIQNQWSGKCWQRAYHAFGEPSDNNTLESLNRVLKTDSNFSSLKSIGMALPHALTVVHRISRDMRALIFAPPVPKKQWVKAQDLMKMDYFKLGFKMGNDLVIPSERLVRTLPGSTTAEQRQNISVWVREFIAMSKNPGAYAKIHGPHAWDFNVMMDYAFSFWVIKKIPTSHPMVFELAREGVGYTCTCPQYMHYHVCKHSLGAAMFLDKKTPPVQCSRVPVGKRSAPAGATLQARGHCLAIDL